MKVNGNTDVTGHVNGKFEQLTDFPLNPKIGTWAFINKSLWVCTEVESKPTWIPLSPERNTVVIPQDTASDTWIVEHNFEKETVVAQCFDGNNEVMLPSSIKAIDINTLEIKFPEVVTGSTIIMFGYEEGASVPSGDFGSGGGGSPVGSIQGFVSKEAMEKFGNGYIGLDGQSITYDVFPDLYVALGGEENGTTPIALPDANGRKAFFRGGRLLSAGFDQIQNDAIRNITGGFGPVDDASRNTYGAFEGGNAVQYDATSNGTGNGAMTVFDASNVVPTADENRPVNFRGYWAIKAFDGTIFDGHINIQGLLDRLSELEKYPTPWVHVGHDDGAPFFEAGLYAAKTEGVKYRLRDKNCVQVTGIARASEVGVLDGNKKIFRLPEDIRNRLPVGEQTSSQFGTSSVEFHDHHASGYMYSYADANGYVGHNDGTGNTNPGWVMINLTLELV